MFNKIDFLITQSELEFDK